MGIKIYISGQISGLDKNEYERLFIIAEDQVFWMKMFDGKYREIINPLNIKPLFGIKRWLFYMISDLWQLRKCTHIAMQDNWIYSKGSCIEYFFAKFIFKLEIIWL